VKMVFFSASAAQKHLARHPDIQWLKDNGDGSALYQLKP